MPVDGIPAFPYRKTAARSSGGVVAVAALAVALLACLAFSVPVIAAEGESWSVIGSKGLLVLWKVTQKNGSSQYYLDGTRDVHTSLRPGTSETEARKVLFALYVAHKRAECAEKASAEEFKSCVTKPLNDPDIPGCMRNWTLQKTPGITTDCG